MHEQPVLWSRYDPVENQEHLPMNKGNGPRLVEQFQPQSRTKKVDILKYDMEDYKNNNARLY